MYTPKILSVNLFKKNLNPTDRQLDLEVTMVRPGTDFTLRFDQSVSYDSRMQYRMNRRCKHLQVLRTHLMYSREFQNVYTYKTMIPEVLFNKFPPPGGTLGELTQDDETPIDYTKMNMPVY